MPAVFDLLPEEVMPPADPLAPFIHQLQWMVITRVVPAVLVAAAVGVALRCTVERLTRAAMQRWRTRRQPAGPSECTRTTALAFAAVESAPMSPPCPICDRTMVQRTAKRGASAGRSFWGCPGYPSCRGTRSVS